MLARPLMTRSRRKLMIYLVHAGLIISNTTIDISPIIILGIIYNRWSHIDWWLSLGLILISYLRLWNNKNRKKQSKITDFLIFAEMGYFKWPIPKTRKYPSHFLSILVSRPTITFHNCPWSNDLLIYVSQLSSLDVSLDGLRPHWPCPVLGLALTINKFTRQTKILIFGRFNPLMIRNNYLQLIYICFLNNRHLI